MANPYVNKVTVNGTDIIDLTADTATAADVASGKTFHLASGAQAVGTASGGGSSSGKVTLYSNSTGKGANTSLTLSDSAANYDYLDIIYTDGTRRYTSRLYEPNGKTFSLFRSVCSGSTVYQNTLMGSVSGTTISLGTEASSITTSSATIKVIKVLGGTDAMSANGVNF